MHKFLHVLHIIGAGALMFTGLAVPVGTQLLKANPIAAFTLMGVYAILPHLITNKATEKSVASQITKNIEHPNPTPKNNPMVTK